MRNINASKDMIKYPLMETPQKYAPHRTLAVPKEPQYWGKTFFQKYPG